MLQIVDVSQSKHDKVYIRARALVRLSTPGH